MVYSGIVPCDIAILETIYYRCRSFHICVAALRIHFTFNAFPIHIEFGNSKTYVPFRYVMVQSRENYTAEDIHQTGNTKFIHAFPLRFRHYFHANLDARKEKRALKMRTIIYSE
ncbi:hypothetical protein Zmor_026770 [Zophobas morio]|uniref:Uncharacterized protein n=1 Tax=Zophobas morio TaxID=2755281 RepID=A0AA38HXN8_9CUCU|nr:hypothetical protein Zmor_026770 [Zophobas morio]